LKQLENYIIVNKLNRAHIIMNLQLRNLSTVISHVKSSDELYLPDFHRNVFKLRNTYEELLGVDEHKDSLLKDAEIAKILTTRDCLNPKNIIHVTIDSLGINQLEKKNHFFDNYRSENEIIELSSVFPTITSTIMGSIHSGLAPQIHGLLGHKIYFPEIGNIINTLTLNVPGAVNIQKDSLVKSGVNPRALMWNYYPPSLYNSEKYKQINFLPLEIAMTGLSHFMLEPESVIPYRTYIDGLEKVRKLLQREEKFYIHFYIGDIDDASHGYGPFSKVYEKTSDLLEYILTKFLTSLDDQISKDTLIAISADHGQNTLFDEKRITFNEEDINRLGELLYAPMGKSGRVLHFYTWENMIDKVKEFLETKIGKGGIVVSWENDLKPLFSTQENYDRLFERLGEVMVILKPHFSIEREYKHESNQEALIDSKMWGHHGSLSKDELLVPLFIDKVSEFKKYL
jgi:hypothetical protein